MYGEVRPLTAGTAEPGAITADGVKLYSFPVGAKAVCEVSWEDSGDQSESSSYDGDITVTAYLGSIGSSYVWFTAVDDGYTTPLKRSYSSATTLYLRVEGVSAGTYSVKYELPVTDLTDGVWQNRDVIVSGYEYYRFPVTAGETYAVYWNDTKNGSDKTLDIEVSAYYETGGTSIFSDVDSGYITPQVFTTASSDNVIIRVEPYSSWSPLGTYAVMYGEVKPLTAGTAEPGAITAGGVKLYSFPAGANTVYEVSWEDSGGQAGGSSYDGDITVTAYRGSIGSNNPSNFTAVDSGYATPRKVSYTSGTTIYLKVEGSSGGTYSVKYGTLPILDLTDGVWQNADMTASGYEDYRFPVTAGETYAVYWNGSYGDGINSLNIKVSAYYETGGAFIFNGVNSGYTTPQVFTAASSGNVIIRVEPYYSGYTGTYAVLYGEVKPLSAGMVESGTITAGGVKLYSFPAGANTVYEIRWEDFGDQAGSSYNGDIRVTAYRGSIGSNVLFNAVNSGYATPQKVNYTSAITIYLKVEGSSAGTYSVKYQQWMPPGTLNITVGFNLGAIAIAGSDGTNIIRKTSGAPSTLTLSAAGYTGVVWYVDGSTPGTSGNTLTMNASNYAVQNHSVTFTGYKNGALFSQTIPFTVMD
jgi:hypothetical protein